MPETPIYIFNLLFAATVVIAVSYGIEAIARSYGIFIYLISILFILSMVMVIPAVKIDYILPVCEKGPTPILKASLQLSSILIYPLVPLFTLFSINSNNSNQTRKAFYKGYLFGSSLVALSIIFSILVLGSTITASAQYPLFQVAKNINLGTIFTRLEFIVAGVWIITLLSRGIIYFYAGTVNLASLLRLKDHKKIILPLGLIIFIYSGIVFSDVINQNDWDTFVWPLFSMTFGLLLPLTMVIAFYIKKIINKR
jgi:spore germination protein KB